jgi:signal transduction histidine kinase
MLQAPQYPKTITGDSAIQAAPASSTRRSSPGRSFRVDDPTFAMVHDLRNPLSAISGCAELLCTRTLDGEQTRRVATTVWRASLQMRSILGEFVSRARGHESPPVNNLGAVLSASCELAGVDQRTDIDLMIDVSPEIDLPMDRAGMERVFLNLIVNALEAMPCGGSIYIAASVTANQVRITVEDTGPGIPTLIRHRLFEPFVTAGKPDGLGLGLAISHDTVRRHGGDLYVESARGARFVVCLPRVDKAIGHREQR